ncbi:MAG: VPS10 domain-containing protein [Gemmatimonadaceae bacterium]
MPLSRRVLSIRLAGAACALALLLPLQPAFAQRGRGAPAAGADSSHAGGPSLAGLGLRSIGPAMISGRITDIAVNPRDESQWYVGAASGGLWKTDNAGTTWTPVFDHEPVYSIGVVTIDPNNPNVVWVGTGEYNAQRSVAYGDGVYKSEDGGKTWKHMGLEHSEHIGRIVVDPRNSNVVYVAAQGPLFSAGGDRGLYKTTDGGKTWAKILSNGTWAGVADVVIDPRDPDRLLAATWQRYRREWGYIAGGPESALWRSTDAGATWTKVTEGLPSGNAVGRYGLALSPQNPDIAYAIVDAQPGGGFYRSTDGGVSWTKMNDYASVGLYYARIYADPSDADRVYAGDFLAQVTDDGGHTFRQVGDQNKHVDTHVFWVDPQNSQHLLVGCDGGLYESFDRGQTYKFFGNLPLAQFYRVETDNALPFYHLYGGTQDNASVGGPSQTRAVYGIANSDWFFTQGGDGFQSRVDPDDPNTVYAQSQNGYLSRFNLQTGENVDIIPQPAPGQPALRWFWDAPLILSPHAPTRLYFGSQVLWQSDDRGDRWRAVSPDLSRQIDRNTLKMMGRVWGVDALGKNTSTSFYGEIVTIGESPLKAGLLWVGTDDGLIQVTEDDGQHWRKIDHVPGVPDTTFISRVTPSAFDTNTVYVAFDNHKSGDFKPYLLRSTDLGRSWTSIAGDLPASGTAYTIIEDSKDPQLLFAGTEFGLYYTANGGKHWTQLKNGLPTIAVRDLEIQKREDDLAVATFGRGYYILDNIAPLRELTPAVLASDGALLPVKRAALFMQNSPLGDTHGGDFYTAPNPPFGATFTYYLKDAIQTKRQVREAADAAAAKKGEDMVYPPWNSLKAENDERPPQLIFTITDAEGRVVRRLMASPAAGVQRVTWDLHYPSVAPVAGTGSGGNGGNGDDGPYVAPGTYRVAMAKLVDGIETPLGVPQAFDVYMLDGTATPRSAIIVAFQQKTAKLQRAVLGANAAAGEAANRLKALRQALLQTPTPTDSLIRRAQALEDTLRAIEETLGGDQTKARYSEPVPPSLLERLGNITDGLWFSTLEDATNTQKQQYDVVASQFGAVLTRLRQFINVDLKQLEDAAEAAGAPWTPGRLPTWDANG